MTTRTELIYTQNPGEAAKRLIETINPDRVFVVGDTTTLGRCWPMISTYIEPFLTILPIVISDGETNKSIRSVEKIWDLLSTNGATRHSLLICLGGGLITDLGGFAAATFKRGIQACYIPTTLLSAVDASIGGKTAVNFNGLKNEVGLFVMPRAIIVSPLFFETLPQIQFLSGYAEMVKMAWLFNPGMLPEMLNCEITRLGSRQLLEWMSMCVDEKMRVIRQDFKEENIRRYLNFGHTAGHAFESLLQKNGLPLPHGVCVAYGCLFALILSHLILGMDSKYIYAQRDFIRENYPVLGLGCQDTEHLIELMGHDKKNPRLDEISFVLLEHPGKPVAGMVPDYKLLRQAFELFNDIR